MPEFAPAGTHAQTFGVKALVYGPPGRGKTPICNTAPRPVLCASEPGLLSMRDSQVMTCLAYTPEAIADFYTWLFSSSEAANYDTICVDSVSQQAEIILAKELTKHKDPRAAYGEMARTMMRYMNGLYFSRNKHTYLICKQGFTETLPVEKAPYFPGKMLDVEVPHLYDEVLQLDLHRVPGTPEPVLAFRCRASYDARARDRSGKLAEFEKPDLTYIFNKILRG